jgi:hypothetical protein
MSIRKVTSNLSDSAYIRALEQELEENRQNIESLLTRVEGIESRPRIATGPALTVSYGTTDPVLDPDLVPVDPDDPRARTTPAQPLLFTASSVAFFGPTGVLSSRVSVTYLPVSSSVTGELIDIVKHELYGRRVGTGEAWRRLTAGTGSDDHLDYEPLTPNENWEFEVRAISGQGIPGQFTDPITITLSGDVTAPPTPSAPTLTSRLGIVTVSWDGKGSLGESQPVDFARCDVYMAGAVIGEITLSGDKSTLQVTDLPYNTSISFTLVAVDTSGNQSIPSASASITVQPLVDTDLIGEIIDGANIVDGSIVASDKIVANTITGGLIQALAINAGHVQANAITATKIAAGAIDGKTITGALVRTAASGQRVELSTSGLTGYDSGGTAVTTVGTNGLLTATGATITGVTQTATSGRRVVINSSTNSVTFYEQLGTVVGDIRTFDANPGVPGSSGKGLILSGYGGSIRIDHENLGSGGSSEIAVSGITQFEDDVYINSVLYDSAGRNLGFPAVWGIAHRTATAVNAGNGSYANMSANAGWTTTSGGGELVGGVTYNNGFQVPISGLYQVSWAALMVNTGPVGIMGITVNKTSGVGGGDLYAFGTLQNGGATGGSGTGLVRLSANSVLTLFGYSVGANGLQSVASCFWSVQLVGY